jgi:organic radical activating enzyme
MKLYVNEFCIGLHSVCNWNCPYCIARDPNGTYDEDEILNEIKPIKYKLKDVYLSGGEPGLLSTYFWDELFNMTEYKLAICTNGTFIKKGYHIRYESKIRSIMIHCVKELNYDIDDEILKVINNKTRYSVEPVIVIHNKNSHLLEEFLEKYHQLNFSLFFTDTTFSPFHHNNEYDYPIQKKSCMEIIKILGKYNKYSRYTTPLTKSIIKNDYRYLNKWSQMNRGL